MCDDVITGIRELGIDPPPRDLVQNRDWEAVLSLYVALDSWNVFAVIAEHIGDHDYARLTRYQWTHSEGDFTEPQFDSIFINHGRNIELADFVITPRERKQYDALPDPFVVYRGCQEETRSGVCWTIYEKVAKRFAARAANEAEDGIGIVISGKCRKQDVIGFFNVQGLHEAEILVKPDNVLDQKDIWISPSVG